MIYETICLKCGAIHYTDYKVLNCLNCGIFMTWHFPLFQKYYDDSSEYCSAILWHKLLIQINREDDVYVEPLKKNVYQIIGCGHKKLKEHFEKYFSNELNWENKTLWHIDHIIPKKYFNLENPNEFAMCWNYKNLRPLLAKENLIKSCKLISNFQYFLTELAESIGIDSSKLNFTNRNLNVIDISVSFKH